MRINIKPLSTNKLFKSRKFRTDLYDVYEWDVFSALRNWKPTIYDQMTFKISVGLSSRNADLDNTLKAFIDILQKKYEFNDSHIYRIEAQKEIVPKGQEYIDVEISPFTTV